MMIPPTAAVVVMAAVACHNAAAYIIASSLLHDTFCRSSKCLLPNPPQHPALQERLVASRGGKTNQVNK
jgi:hypothetical protein